MKIDLNLSLLPRPRERYALTWSVPVALVGLVGLVILSALSVKALRNYHNVRQTLQEVQERELQLRDREAEFRRELAKPQYQQLSRDTQFVNALIGKKYLALTELTARITRTLPPTVKLTSLALARPVPDPLLRITVSGQTAEAVEGFLARSKMQMTLLTSRS